MVKVVYILMCLLLLCNIASASDYSVTDAGADMVAKGIQKALITAADNMYGAFNNNTDINEEFGTPQGALVRREDIHWIAANPPFYPFRMSLV